MNKIGFWTPYLHSHRGNTTTAKRIAAALCDEGYQVELFAFEEEKWSEQDKVRMETCDLYHILHFNRFSTWMDSTDIKMTKPYVITSGGTDVNEQMENPISRRLLAEAGAITVFTDEAGQKVISVYPELEQKVHVIPQSVYIPERQEKPEKDFPEGKGPNLLLPAGLREVKDVFHIIDRVEGLKEMYPDLQFMIVGESLDPEISRQVKDYEQNTRWFHYIGSLPIEQMAYVYQWADIALNTSKSEGQPIALMEAMYYGVPVIARSNGGNESLIRHGENGFIYHEPASFNELVIQLMENGNLYDQFSKNGKSIMDREFSIEKEIQHFKEIYQQITR